MGPRALALVGLLALGCGGPQRPAPSWDTEALAAIHGTAHALVLADDGAAAFYRARTDAISLDGGPGGAPLRGAAYVEATAAIDARMVVVVHDFVVTREALVLAESLVRQARALGDASSRCRASLAIDALVADTARVALHAEALGVELDPAIRASAVTLDAVASHVGTGCHEAAVPSDAAP